MYYRTEQQDETEVGGGLGVGVVGSEVHGPLRDRERDRERARRMRLSEKTAEASKHHRARVLARVLKNGGGRKQVTASGGSSLTLNNKSSLETCMCALGSPGDVARLRDDSSSSPHLTRAKQRIPTLCMYVCSTVDRHLCLGSWARRMHMLCGCV